MVLTVFIAIILVDESEGKSVMVVEMLFTHNFVLNCIAKIYEFKERVSVC